MKAEEYKEFLTEKGLSNENKALLIDLATNDNDVSYSELIQLINNDENNN